MKCMNCNAELDHLEHGATKTCTECGTKTKKPVFQE